MSGNRDLLDFLRQNNESWITAKTLAMTLGISERTVKSKIAQLRTNGIDIKSGPKGYKIKNNTEINGLKDYLPNNSSQRSSWLIRRLMKSKNAVNIYDLSGQLYINEVELRKELKSLEQEFSNFNLNLIREGDFYRVEGKEENKRKFLSSIIYHELNGTLLNENLIQKYFPDVNVKVVSFVLRQSITKAHVKIDSFNFSNILLHLVIMIDRSDKSKRHPDTEKVNDNLVKLIIIGLNDNIDYSLSEYDINQLETMFELLLGERKVELPESSQINKLFERIVLFVRKTYDLDLDEELFKKRFLPHLLRLIDRFKNNNIVHNPLAKNIKNSSPTIYECATLIAYEIKNFLGILVSEEEIAFIALHVGNIVTEQVRNENKVICQLFMLDYHGNSKTTIDALDKKFSNDMVLLNAISDETDILDETQLVIVANSKQIIKNHHFVQISSFLLPNDINKIQKALKQIKDMTLSNELKIGLDKFTSEINFVRDNRSRSAQEVIHYVSEQFFKEKIVGSEFEDKILEREKLSSTAFGLVAIPHTIDYDAKKSQWFIYINSKGVKWGNQRVYVIIVLASSQKDEKKFRKVFDELSEVIINDNKVSKLTACKTYQEFVDEIVKIE
ncbi:BglG family transcription antiterminator [Xylocopilactobacillus apis]|uniref:Transcriptional antiterminator n=1 Tax=Xylocopilactobacillus apis TaxID=2932183 RepID=A0AAU9DJS7_9LACO|nr:PTS sugar transporter subunit IIA [Xylocopilactobacillus apis]BDR57042.1 transcriptional antiterminator [Xylocopilactobacillus apis]